MENAYLLYMKVKTGEKIRRGPFPRADMERMISIGAELMADYGPPEKCDQIVLLSVLEPAPEGRPGESLEIEARSLSREIVDKMLEISKERKRRKNDRSSTKGMAPS